MLRKQRTDTVSPCSFKRIARLAMVGLVLVGLTACGGGGGSSTPAKDPTPASDPAPAPAPTPTPTPAPTPAPTPSPEIPITPAPTDHPDTLEAALDIPANADVESSIDSPEDVDFFKLKLTGPSTVSFWTSGDAKTAIALLDGEGNDLSAPGTSSTPGSSSGIQVQAAATTAGAVVTDSDGRVSVTTGLDEVFARVRGRGGSTGDYNLHNEVAQDLAPRVLSAFSGVTVQAGGDPVTVDLSNHFTDPEGGSLTFSTSFPTGQVGPVSLALQISGSILEITSPANMRAGPISISVTASDPVGLFTVQVLTVTVTSGGNRPEAEDPADCIDVRISRFSEYGCQVVNEGRGGWNYHAQFMNRCTEEVSIRYEWSKFSDTSARPTSGSTGAGAGGTNYTFETNCISGNPPTLRVCVDWNDAVDDRCYGSGADAHHQPYSYSPE